MNDPCVPSSEANLRNEICVGHIKGQMENIGKGIIELLARKSFVVSNIDPYT